MAVVALQVDSLGNVFPSEYVMASSYPLGESQIPKQTAQVVEADIGIRSTPDEEPKGPKRSRGGTSTLKPSRTGTKHIGGHFPPEVAKQLRQLAVDEDTSHQKLLGEALDLLFQSRRLPTIASK